MCFICLLSGCVEYTEEWRFNPDGSGTVTMQCVPTDTWEKTLQDEVRTAATALFMPHFQMISQMCAYTSLTLEDAYVAWHKDVPHAYVRIVFDSLADVSASPLFTDRHMHWHRTGRDVHYWHSLPATPSPAAAALAAFPGAADVVFIFRWHMPYRLVKTEGAKETGRRVAEKRFTLQESAAHLPLTVNLTARGIHWRFWRRVGGSLLVVCAGAGVLLFVKRQRTRARKETFILPQV